MDKQLKLRNLVKKHKTTFSFSIVGKENAKVCLTTYQFGDLD